MVFVKYSRDVKVIVVKLSLRGLALEEINNTIDHKVSPDLLRRWNRLYRTTRDVVRDPALYADRGRPLLFTAEEREFILAALDLEPTLYLDEIQSLAAMTGELHPLSSLSDELRNLLNFTKKVARTVHPKQCPHKRAVFTATIGPYPSNYFVFIDECGVSLGTHSRNKVWATRGRWTSRIHREHNATRVSVLPAVSLDGILCVMAQEGSMPRVDIEYFLEDVLMPGMNPFPGRNSFLIMDNAAIHHRGRISDICMENQVLLVYLPPYSPDMNPIEKVFSALKSQLKQQQLLTGTKIDADIIKAFLPTLVTPGMMGNLFRGSGYRA